MRMLENLTMIIKVHGLQKFLKKKRIRNGPVFIAMPVYLLIAVIAWNVVQKFFIIKNEFNVWK